MKAKSEEIFLPDFCSFRMLLVVFILAELLAFLMTLAADFSVLGFLSAFGIRSLLALWLVLTSTAALCLLRRVLCRFNNFTVGLLAFLLIQSLTVLVSWLVVDALPAWGYLMPMIKFEETGYFYFKMLGISGIISLAFLRYLYVLYQWRKQVEAEARANLDALQARMRPHFLFNSLNTIASLTRIDPVKAELLIEDLAELIRGSLLIDRERMVRFDQEVSLAKLYLNIESHRLEQRLRVRWDIDKVPKDALLPPLSLQPIIENAVYHGIETIREGGEIVIKGVKRFGSISIAIYNSLPPAGTTTQRKGNQMAMQNLRARVTGYYAGDGAIDFVKTDKHYQVYMIVPYWTEQP